MESKKNYLSKFLKYDFSDRKNFSARGAGILGFSRFGKGREFLLDKNMEISFETLYEINNTYPESKILFFG